MGTRPVAQNIHLRTGTKRSLTYIWGEDEDRDMIGWVPQGWAGSVVYGMGVAHDVLEHRTYDDVNLSELDALGRMAVVRYHGGYVWGTSTYGHVLHGTPLSRDSYFMSVVHTIEDLARDADLHSEAVLLEPAEPTHQDNLLISALKPMLSHIASGDLMINILNHLNEGYKSISCDYADQWARTFESIEAHTQSVRDNYEGQHLTVNTYWKDPREPPGVEFEVDGDIQELCLPPHLLE